MAAPIPIDVLRRFKAVKPDHTLVAVGRDRPAGGGCYRAVDVLCTREDRVHNVVVWMLVLADDGPDFCSNGYYTDSVEDGEAELARRRR